MDNETEILIVEDSLTQALALQFILEEHDYRVAVANNGREALDYLKHHTPTLIIIESRRGRTKHLCSPGWLPRVW